MFHSPQTFIRRVFALIRLTIHTCIRTWGGGVPPYTLKPLFLQKCPQEVRTGLQDALNDTVAISVVEDTKVTEVTFKCGVFLTLKSIENVGRFVVRL